MRRLPNYSVELTEYGWEIMRHSRICPNDTINAGTYQTPQAAAREVWALRAEDALGLAVEWMETGGCFHDYEKTLTILREVRDLKHQSFDHVVALGNGVNHAPLAARSAAPGAAAPATAGQEVV